MEERLAQMTSGRKLRPLGLARYDGGCVETFGERPGQGTRQRTGLPVTLGASASSTRKSGGAMDADVRSTSSAQNFDRERTGPCLTGTRRSFGCVLPCWDPCTEVAAKGTLWNFWAGKGGL